MSPHRPLGGALDHTLRKAVLDEHYMLSRRPKKQTKKLSMALVSLDAEKAFECLSWPFPYKIL